MRSNGVQGLRFRVEANFLEAMWTSSIGLYWEEKGCYVAYRGNNPKLQALNQVKLVGSDLLVVTFDLLGFWRCEHNLWRCVGSNDGSRKPLPSNKLRSGLQVCTLSNDSNRAQKLQNCFLQSQSNISVVD